MYLLNKQTNKKKNNKFNKADLTKRKRAIMEIANRSTQGFPGGLTGKESACNAGDLNSIRVGKIPQRRTQQPTPVFLPGESPWTEEPGGLQSMESQRVRHN